MIEFSKQISEKWAISQALSDLLCSAYEKGDSPYFLAEYDLQFAVSIDVSTIWDVYDYLGKMEELVAKRKRVLNAYKKAEKLTPALEKRISLTTNTYELDDLLIPLRPNPRSKGQMAAKKGVGPLVDRIISQEEEELSVEEMAKEYVGTHTSLKNADDVVQAAKDLMAERFAYDDTARTMARDFMREDGFFEIAPKSKKDETYSRYVGKLVPIDEFSKEELLRLLVAEDNKRIKLKLNVQLFRITELFRHHFIENPDSTSFDIICEAIDDMWLRLLHPTVERDVKQTLRGQAEEWASKEITSGLQKRYTEEKSRDAVFVLDASGKKNLNIVAVSARGDLLGATSERKPAEGKPFSSERIRQFFQRHRPSQVLIADNDKAEIAESIVDQLKEKIGFPVEVTRYKAPSKSNISHSEWIKKREFAILEPQTRELLGSAVIFLQPLSLVPQLGTTYYKIHPLQDTLPEDKFVDLVNRILDQAILAGGVNIKEIADSPIAKFRCMNKNLLEAIRTADLEEPIGKKNDLLKVKSMTETAFRNIAGFVVVPSAEDLLDKSAVHPDFFPLVEEIVDQLTVSHETIVINPEVILPFAAEDPHIRTYVGMKLVPQLQVAQRYLAIGAAKTKRKLKLSEVKEGAVVSGRVTNITPFGVFVNINAVCDGLIHISQLADEYVETPDQVVSVGDRVDVRILKVDVKKRRISLSMKNLGNKAPKVKPSKGQLSNLAEHFKNR
ncbi:MAG: S1 RNA-binding domain-containing protein [Chitinispirillaceae bacterium]